MTDKTDMSLRDAAQAVIDRWETPLWKDAPATAVFIADLRKALARDAGRASLAASAGSAITPETGNPVSAQGAAITSESGAASAGSEPVAAYSIDADPLGIRSTVAESITGALAFGAQGVNPPPEGHWLAPFWKAAMEDKEALRVKRDLRNELQQQCSTWGTYWRGSDAHGVVLSHPQAVELLENALGVEVEIKVQGCQVCDYTGAIGDMPCPACPHLSPLEGAGWQPIETAPKDGVEIILRRGDRIGCAMWCHWPATEVEEAGAGWSVGLDGYTWDGQDAPTHWMPLPPPPTSSADSRKGE